jgi:hypothetical protein
VVAGVLVSIIGSAHAQPSTEGEGSAAPPAPEPSSAPEPAPAPLAPEPPVPVEAPPPAADTAFHVPAFQVHGFVGEGGFVSTANNYIGASSRGSLALFEAGLNVSSELSDRLRVGMQLYGRDVGTFRDLPPRLDWAYLDYRWKDSLGLRAGIIKMPFGLYNEYADVDAARTSILMPQSVYPLRDRSALLAQTGFSVYGARRLGKGAGSLDYQAWLGTLDIPANALEINGATLDSIDTHYVTGAQLFWRTPVEGLRVGGSILRLSVDFDLTLSDANTAALIMAGVVPATYDGKLVISQRPVTLWVTSAEYTRDNWLFAAEYSQSYKHQQSTLPAVLPAFDEDAERFYALATHRIGPLELGAYYSVLFADVHDRHGHNQMKFPQPYDAWQRDASLTIRYDVTDRWLWKVEGHFIDGVADLFLSDNPKPERYWGLVLVKTGVTF